MNPSKSHQQALDNLGVIVFSGDDAASFLQGQLSNDINELGASWQFSGYCNPKGRLLAIMQLWKHEGSIYAVLDKSLADSTVNRLKMYVMRSKVTIEVLENARCFGLIGPQFNAANYSLEIRGDKHHLNFDGRQLRIETNPSSAAASKLSDQATTEATQLSWNAANINRGLPHITTNTIEMFVPQMVNLDIIGGINFKKGCYTGQEIVARMHYLGKVKQRMFVCQLDTESSANAKITEGDKILLKDNQDKAAGNIVMVDQLEQVALAVLRTEMVDAKLSFILENGDGVTVLSEQPYEINKTA